MSGWVGGWVGGWERPTYLTGFTPFEILLFETTENDRHSTGRVLTEEFEDLGRWVGGWVGR